MHIIAGVKEVPEEIRDAKRVVRPLYLIKLAFASMVLFTILGFLSSFLKLDDTELLFDLAKISAGFLFGSGVSVGFSR